MHGPFRLVSAAILVRAELDHDGLYRTGVNGPQNVFPLLGASGANLTFGAHVGQRR